MILRRLLLRIKRNTFALSMRSKCQKRVMHLVFTVLCIILISLIYTRQFSRDGCEQVETSTPEPLTFCQFNRSIRHYNKNTETYSRQYAGLTDAKILILVQSQFSKFKEVAHILEANHLRYRIEAASQNLPPLTHSDRGRFSLIIFENFESYIAMDNWNRESLDKYCREYHVGQIAFFPLNDHESDSLEVKGFSITAHYDKELSHYYLNPSSDIWRVTRADKVFAHKLPASWTVFHANHSTYQTIAYSTLLSSSHSANIATVFQSTVLHDKGIYDGIQRILFGYGVSFWIHKLIFIDCLAYLSHGKLSTSLDRFIQIDIDDIFVGKSGTRMMASDADALLAGQTRLQNYIKDFRFNLGFSGKYFLNGNCAEDEGDRRLLELGDNFRWFCHMWRHEQPHKFNKIRLLHSLRQNNKFAQAYGLPTFNYYAVSPHHSGVYPVHEELYVAWKDVWGIKVTTTEEYPHLRPARLRQGFIYHGIMVLPRQTCGLFTHTLYLSQYPGGRQRLDRSIEGGDLFDLFLYNPVNVFMTHMSNYGSDRLGLYTFESVFNFVSCWTNLHLRTLPPLDLAHHYFDLYPEQREPIWQNPCDDRRQLEIWAANKTCSQLPKFLIVGPQKTGTTALYMFLKMHPSIVSNYPSSQTFEEIQFFNNGKNYQKGLDWYLKFFPLSNDSSVVTFEKSANYFDNEYSPLRVSALLPKAKIIMIFINPIKRAYSWYWHMRMRSDTIANKYSFYDVIMADSNSPKRLRDLHKRCLFPGHYAQHLEQWLDFFPTRQLHIIDGDLLKSDPIEVMRKLQHFLHTEPFLDYSQKLRYDKQKGFFCQIINGDHSNCLGRSKGRNYPPMDSRSRTFLSDYYQPHNEALKHLLDKHNLDIPQWLYDKQDDVR